MFHLISLGILMGLGAAIPIGAINLEIIRRNLSFGTLHGVAFGLGASLADVTYLIILSYGALKLFAVPGVMKIIGIIGALFLAWFGFKAIVNSDVKPPTLTHTLSPAIYLKNSYDGYLMTFFNPYNILFWSSVGITIATNTGQTYASFLIGLGVLSGVLLWIIFLNGFLHLTRHKISNTIMKKINISGGLILIGFGIYSLYRTFI